MRLPDRRRWVTPVAGGIAVLALVAVGAIARAALGPAGTRPLADPSPAPSLPEPTVSPSPSPEPDSPSPTPVDTATQRPVTTPGPGDPVPKTYPGRKQTKFIFSNYDPEYDAVFYIGTDRYGPFKPWQRSGSITHETYAGLVFRLEFPKRHNCDDANAPLERPLDGVWDLHAERVYMSHECGMLGVSWAGSDGKDIPVMEPWSFPPSPTPTRTATTPPPPTPAATPTETATPTP
jgi:hypothetical protein